MWIYCPYIFLSSLQTYICTHVYAYTHTIIKESLLIRREPLKIFHQKAVYRQSHYHFYPPVSPMHLILLLSLTCNFCKNSIYEIVRRISVQVGERWNWLFCVIRHVRRGYILGGNCDFKDLSLTQETVFSMRVLTPTDVLQSLHSPVALNQLKWIVCESSRLQGGCLVPFELLHRMLT